MSEKNTLSIEEANQLVLEFQDWAERIARSVARGWNVHWKTDGLDGAAMEALIFCSRRYDPTIGVPFKSYARRRIHEASTEAARKSKSWEKDSRTSKRTERLARAISAELFEVFPSVRSGVLPGDDNSEGSARVGIQQLLIGACLIATKQGMASGSPDEATDMKSLITVISKMEPIHQLLMWKVYWEGHSLRGVASEWETDELNVIREHKAILAHVQKTFTTGKKLTPLRIRPGLTDANLRQAKNENYGIFSKQISAG